MRIGLLVIGVLLIVGGLGAIIKPAPYSVTARPNPAGDISFSDPKAEASTHQVNPRSVGYGAAVFGGIVILAALSLKEVSVPEPHGHPLPPSDF